MDQANAVGMEMIAAVAGNGAGGWVGNTAGLIERIAEQGVSLGGEMDANLVRSAGDDVDLQQG